MPSLPYGQWVLCLLHHLSQPTLQNAQRTCPILQQQPYKSMEVPQQYLLATFTLFFHSSLDIYSCHQDHHHPVGVVPNPHPLPILYTPEITTGLTAKHQVLCLSGTYSAENWVFGKYVQVFQLAVSLSLVLFSMMIIVSWKSYKHKEIMANRLRLSSTFQIRLQVLELKLGGHKSLNCQPHIGGQIILKGKFNFLIVLFYVLLFSWSSSLRFSGQIEDGGVTVYKHTKLFLLQNFCCISELESVHAVFGYL